MSAAGCHCFDLAYAYFILSSQASARSGIVGNAVSALTAQSAFLNNFENVVILSVIKTLLVTHLVRSITSWGKHLHVTQ